MVISRPVPASALDDEALVTAARAGDRHAAGVYIARHRETLIRAARAIAGSRHDPEDLLSAALVQLLGQWDQGTGPASNAAGYVVRSMRNAVIDEVRSPRSRVETFGDVDERDPLHGAAEDPRFRQAELHEEFDVVRRALERLPADQRLVLRETVVDGRKPADVAADARRSATAISSLAARARRGLRRAVLIELLTAGGADCSENAARLPESVATTPDAHREGERGLAHVRDCPRCRANWARFATLTSALGILPALVVADWTAGAAPAAAAPGTTSSGADAGSTIGATPVRAGGGYSAAAWSALPRPGLLARAAAATRVAVRLPLVLAGAAALVIGAAVGTTALALDERDPSRVEVARTVIPAVGGPADTSSFRLDAGVQHIGSVAVLSLRLDLPRETWVVERATLRLPAGVRLRSAPIDWRCAPDGEGVACLVDGTSPNGGALAFEAADGWVDGGFDMRLDVLTGGGDRFAAMAEGTFGEGPIAPADGFDAESRLY